MVFRLAKIRDYFSISRTTYQGICDSPLSTAIIKGKYCSDLQKSKLLSLATLILILFDGKMQEGIILQTVCGYSETALHSGTGLSELVVSGIC